MCALCSLWACSQFVYFTTNQLTFKVGKIFSIMDLSSASQSFISLCKCYEFGASRPILSQVQTFPNSNLSTSPSNHHWGSSSLSAEIYLLAVMRRADAWPLAGCTAVWAPKDPWKMCFLAVCSYSSSTGKIGWKGNRLTRVLEIRTALIPV